MNELQHKQYANDEIEFMVRRLTEEAPILLKALYPKRILTPHNYFNPKWYALTLAIHYQNWLKPENTMLPHTTCAMMALMATKYGLPTYFVQPEFAEAVAATDPPEDFFLKDIRFPMPALVFVLPDAFVHKHFGYYCPFIGVATAPQGLYPAAAAPYPATELDLRYANALKVSEERLVLHFPMFHRNAPATDYTGNYPLKSNLSIIEEAPFHDATGFEGARFEAATGHTYTFPEDQPEGEAEVALQRKLTFFTVKLLLALTAEPQYIVPGSLQRKAKAHKGRERDELWNPTIIGAKFRVQRTSTPGDGTHASPRWHWRRTRMTYQVVGKRTPDFVYREALPKDEKGRVDWAKVSDDTRARFWSNHKLMWLKPTLVNAPEAPRTLRETADLAQ